jgi:hypothetical protein
MDHRQMEAWLNKMGADGWEFAGYAQKALGWVGTVCAGLVDF